jgi:LysR family hydrogen peroxide-inducible transcriptional activator
MASITQLEYVVALDQCRHFGRAASTVSRVAANAERAIAQTGRGNWGWCYSTGTNSRSCPPKTVRAFIEQAKVVLTEFKRFSLLGNRSADELSGEFRLAVLPTIAPYLMPLFLGKFTKRYPRIELAIEEMSTERIIEALDKDQIDAGVLAHTVGLVSRRGGATVL